MKETNLIAGWPLASWLSFIAALILAAFVVVQYQKSHVISWAPFAAFILLLASAVIMGRRNQSA